MKTLLLEKLSENEMSQILRAYGEANWDFPDPQCCYAPDIPSAMLYQ